MSTPALNPLVDKIRTAHPGAYDDMDDATLTKRVLAKYPQYSDLAVPGPTSAAKPAPPHQSPLVGDPNYNMDARPSAGDMALGTLKDLGATSAPNVGYQLYKKYTGQPNTLGEIPEKASMLYGPAAVGEIGGVEPPANPGMPTPRAASPAVGEDVARLGRMANVAARRIPGVAFWQDMVKAARGPEPPAPTIPTPEAPPVSRFAGPRGDPNLIRLVRAEERPGTHSRIGSPLPVQGAIRHVENPNRIPPGTIPVSEPRTAASTSADIQNAARQDPTLAGLEKARRGRSAEIGQKYPAKQMPPEEKQEVVTAPAEKAPSGFYERHGRIASPEEATEPKQLGSQWPPEAPQVIQRKSGYQSLKDEEAIKEEIGHKAGLQDYTRKRAAGQGSAPKSKGQLVQEAGGSVPSRPVKLTKTPPAGTTVPQTAEESIGALKKSLDAVKRKPKL